MTNPLEDKICNVTEVLEYKEWLEQYLLEDSEIPFEELEEFEEYKDIVEFINELAEDSSVIENEEIIIREDYWEEYVEEMVKDWGYIDKTFPSWIVIDWRATGDNLFADYCIYTYQDYKYYIRL